MHDDVEFKMLNFSSQRVNLYSIQNSKWKIVANIALFLWHVIIDNVNHDVSTHISPIGIKFEKCTHTC